MVVIGSEALSYHVNGIVPNDLDLVGTYEEVEEFRKKFKATTFYPINAGKSMFMRNAEGKICEIEIAWEGSRAEKLWNFVKNNPANVFHCNICTSLMTVPTLDVLYMLKMSHRYLKDSPHFLKTMRDIQTLRERGCKIRPEHGEFYRQRMEDTYTYNHPKLNVTKGDFFDAEATGVEYTYDHDSIHESVKTLERPAYTYFLEDEVKCSMDMFFACPEHVRLRAGMEEAMVLAIERSLVPFPGAMSPKEAFDYALMKVCTSITSGWFREFCWENYDDIQALFDEYPDYFDQFKRGLFNGVVQPFTGKVY